MDKGGWVSSRSIRLGFALELEMIQRTEDFIPQRRKFITAFGLAFLNVGVF